MDLNESAPKIKPNNAMIKAVIFDCDGVMFDTARANTAYYNQLLNHFGKPDMTPAQFQYIQMHTVGNSISFLFGDDAETNQLVKAYRDAVGYEPFYPLMEIEPDLKSVLNQLKPHYITAIATNRSDTIGRVLEVHGLTDLFDLVVSCLDVPNPKPHPDPLLKVIDHFKLIPQQAVYIGDSSIDQEAAKAADIPLIAFGNREMTAYAHIDRMNELTPILETFS